MALRITPAYAGKRYHSERAQLKRRDHPRVCGEKSTSPLTCGWMTGSPPRMRGKVSRLRERLKDDGITPAYAGKSLRRWRRKTRIWDHPRVCGEKEPTCSKKWSRPGSPPRMRGKVLFERETFTRNGDHPRVCGEKRSVLLLGRRLLGSPPRMRGKALLQVRRGDGAGITPAYAGKRCRRSSTSCGARDHPRVCGEKSHTLLSAVLTQGSPPRMRGKEISQFSFAGLTGITPAYAGKSATATTAPALNWDHPRVCGEKSRNASSDSSSAGSPPRMRGKATSRATTWSSPRITPAYAGKSSRGASCVAPAWDHPRVCGEKRRCDAGNAAAVGSPPRMRGKA